MLIKTKDLKDIQKNRVTLVKNFINLERNYDFNLISKFLEENNSEVITKTNLGNLKNVYQMLNTTNYLPEFKIFFDFLFKIFKYKFDFKNQLELYFSFTPQVGVAHKDVEDVFIIGLMGKTIYRIYDNKITDYEIKKGDMIFIPCNVKHKAIGITPRIIASIGFYT
tara:strand:+ start:64 stop:561 length:498 start_codon:yes stop_codon:yes gene_type:complete